MNKIKNFFNKKSFRNQVKYLNKPKFLIAFSTVIILGTVTGIVYAGPGHGNIEPVKEQRSEQVLLRKVGDTDTDSISKEGLSSFYGEITSTDISSVHSTVGGTISTWNVAVGQKVTRNQLLGTVNGSVSILAQRSGEVASIDKNIGDYISVEDRIGLISGSDPKKIVRFTIPASWKNISRGDSLDISWRPDFAIGTGSITGISSVINQKGGYQAQADISEETPFPIGASVRIIPNNSKKGVFVQRKSIVFENAQPYVWLVTENDIIRKQKVTPGRSLGEYVEIISGIERGFSYLVVLDPTVVLENGVSITEIIKEIRVVGNSDSTHDESVPHVH